MVAKISWIFQWAQIFIRQNHWNEKQEFNPIKSNRSLEINEIFFFLLHMNLTITLSMELSWRKLSWRNLAALLKTQLGISNYLMISANWYVDKFRAFLLSAKFYHFAVPLVVKYYISIDTSVLRINYFSQQVIWAALITVYIFVNVSIHRRVKTNSVHSSDWSFILMVNAKAIIIYHYLKKQESGFAI